MSEQNGNGVEKKNKVLEALDLLEENTDLSLEDRLDHLWQEIVSMSWNNIRLMATTGQKITPELREIQKEMIYEYNIIEKMVHKLKKDGRLSKDTKEVGKEFNDQLLDRIKKKKSSIAAIVQSIPKPNP